MKCYIIYLMIMTGKAGMRQEIFFLYFGMHYNSMCNEIEYVMLEEYLAKVKQKDTKEKEPKKQIIVAA